MPLDNSNLTPKEMDIVRTAMQQWHYTATDCDDERSADLLERAYEKLFGASLF